MQRTLVTFKIPRRNNGRINYARSVATAMTANPHFPSPKPTLADAGSEARAKYPGRAALDRSIGLDDAGWARFADGLARVVERCRELLADPPPADWDGSWIARSK